MSEDYSLGKSAKGLGQLYPILKDARGNIIDGFHRQNEDPDWHTLTRDQIDSDQKLELARLATNFCRRTISGTEFQNRLRFLVGKCGMKVAEIAEVTGISDTTIYKYLPQELKEPSKVDAGKASGEARISVPRAEQTVKTQDSEEPKLQKPTITPIQAAISPEDFILCAGCMSKVHKDRAVPLSKDDPEHFVHPTEHCRDLARERLKHVSKPSPLREENPRETKPSDFDSYPTKRDRMGSCHSQIEQDFRMWLEKYREVLGPICAGRKIEVIVIESDAYLPNFEAHAFLDGNAVHLDRREKDAWLRGLVEKHHPDWKLVDLPYERNTPKTVAELGWKFLEKVGKAEEARELDRKNGETVKP